MQYQPPVSPIMGSSPDLPPQMYVMPPTAQPVVNTRSNGYAVAACVFGVLTFLATAVLFLILASTPWMDFLSRYAVLDLNAVTSIYQEGAWILAIGGFFAMFSILFGHAGLAKSRFTDGRGIGASAASLALGYFFFASFIIGILLSYFTLVMRLSVKS